MEPPLLVIGFMKGRMRQTLQTHCTAAVQPAVRFGGSCLYTTPQSAVEHDRCALGYLPQMNCTV